MILDNRKIALGLVDAIQTALSSTASENNNGFSKPNEKVLNDFIAQADQEDKSAIEKIPQLSEFWNNLASLNSQALSLNSTHGEELKKQNPHSAIFNTLKKIDDANKLIKPHVKPIAQKIESIFASLIAIQSKVTPVSTSSKDIVSYLQGAITAINHWYEIYKTTDINILADEIKKLKRWLKQQLC